MATAASAAGTLPPPAAAAGVGPKIKRLDPEVVNRIAAGEVIHRPFNALKEMLENSIDARASSVSVTVKDGGLTLLQVQDNGCGIAKEDFPLVCERFATSKLAAFEDLSSIQTYGFRGEALASISLVAKVTVTSMRAGAPCAYRGAFADGKLTGGPGQPKPCAGVKGTTITVEDMFHSMPPRRAAIKNLSEEYARILEVVERYAIQHAARAPAGVAFLCKKAGSTSPDVQIPAKTSRLDAIGLVYGTGLKRELLPLAVEQGAASSSGGAAAAAEAVPDPDAPTFSASGYVSNANYSSKRSVFILFINDRLVDCAPLKKAVDAVYAELLPRGAHPFVYLSITLPPSHVDVNMHPTKREVGFLHEDLVIDRVVAALQRALGGANASRSFATQTVLPLPPLTAAGGLGSSAEGAAAEDNSRIAKAGVDYDAIVASGGGGGAGAAKGAAAGASADDGSGSSKWGSLGAAAKDKDGAAAAATQSAASSSKPVAGSSNKTLASSAGYPHKTVRVDASSFGTLDSFVVATQRPPPAPAAAAAAAVVTQESATDAAEGGGEGGALNVSGAASASSSSLAAVRAQRRAARSQPALARNPIVLTSVLGLLDAIAADAHEGLASALKRHVFVGVVSRHLSLMQQSTKLLLVNHTQLARELFFQQVFRLFGNARAFALDPPVDVATSLFAVLTAQAGCAAVDAWSPEAWAHPGAQERWDAAVEAADALVQRSEMLAEYFSIGFVRVAGSGGGADEEGEASSAEWEAGVGAAHAGDKRPRQVCEGVNEEGAGPAKRARLDGVAAAASDAASDAQLPPAARASRVVLTTLPRLVDGHTPLLTHLPDFLASLIEAVNWEEERPCFVSLAQCIAAFYAELPPAAPAAASPQLSLSPAAASSSSSGDSDEALLAAAATASQQLESARSDPSSLFCRVAHVLYPAFRNVLVPPRKLARDHYVVQVACTEQLYRIFERC